MIIHEDQFPTIYLTSLHRFHILQEGYALKTKHSIHGQSGATKLSTPQTGVSAEQKADHKLTQHKALVSTQTVTISQALNYSINFLEED